MQANNEFSISGNIVDIVNKRVFKGTVKVIDGTIQSIKEEPAQEDQYILPGFVDAHIHIESSMLIPSEFARLAVVHGTVGTVSDPHEIANVVGIEGVKYMINNGNKVPFKFNFGAPSCVPATIFETAGACIDITGVKELLAMKEIRYLSEMMNFPGVLAGDELVMEKIKAAHDQGKVVDGHAPGLMGEQAKKYIEAGISTDHECFTREEALDKIKHGMKIIIREGSAAKNYDALIDLLNEYPDLIMFCSDDKHPNELVLGHINLLVKRSIAHGIEPMKVLRAASLNPIKHYGLDIGLLQEGDPADFIIADNLNDLTILKTYINGILVASSGDTLIQSVEESEINNFNCKELKIPDIELVAETPQIKVIEALDGQLITNQLNLTGKVREGKMVSDPENDILKIIVHNRYQPASPSIAFVKNFGLKSGAIASTVAHDSHNIIAVGVSDEDIINAVNLLIRSKGGVSLVSDQITNLVKLPVAGLMSVADGYLIADEYGEIDQMAKDLGASLSAPYMTLSFLALLVIPKLKLSDKGLFDGEIFSFTSNFDHP